jgi:hypothetical protein
MVHPLVLAKEAELALRKTKLQDLDSIRFQPTLQICQGILCLIGQRTSDMYDIFAFNL